MTQLALNAKVSNTTKITLFFVNYSKELNLFKKERKHLLAQLVVERIATLKKIHNNISKMQEKLIKYQSKKRKTTSQLKKRNKIYLFTKNLKTRKLSKKLNHVKVESFLVKKAKKLVNYELDLFKDAKVFLVFYILLLELANPITPLQETFYYKDQKIEDDSTRAFATKQLKDFKTFDSSILDNKHCVFRFVFALIFFKIFLFRSNRIITIANIASSSTILTKRFSLL